VEENTLACQLFQKKRVRQLKSQERKQEKLKERQGLRIYVNTQTIAKLERIPQATSLVPMCHVSNNKILIVKRQQKV
jgi:hypothetical protein